MSTPTMTFPMNLNGLIAIVWKYPWNPDLGRAQMISLLGNHIFCVVYFHGGMDPYEFTAPGQSNFGEQRTAFYVKLIDSILLPSECVFFLFI